MGCYVFPYFLPFRTRVLKVRPPPTLIAATMYFSTDKPVAPERNNPHDIYRALAYFPSDGQNSEFSVRDFHTERAAKEWISDHHDSSHSVILYVNPYEEARWKLPMTFGENDDRYVLTFWNFGDLHDYVFPTLDQAQAFRNKIFPNPCEIRKCSSGFNPPTKYTRKWSEIATTATACKNSRDGIGYFINTLLDHLNELPEK